MLVTIPCIEYTILLSNLIFNYDLIILDSYFDNYVLCIKGCILDIFVVTGILFTFLISNADFVFLGPKIIKKNGPYKISTFTKIMKGFTILVLSN